MVQFSSPMPESIPDSTGGTNKRTLNRTDQGGNTDDSGFAASLEKEKAAVRKDQSKEKVKKDASGETGASRKQTESPRDNGGEKNSLSPNQVSRKQKIHNKIGTSLKTAKSRSVKAEPAAGKKKGKETENIIPVALEGITEVNLNKGKILSSAGQSDSAILSSDSSLSEDGHNARTEHASLQQADYTDPTEQNAQKKVLAQATVRISAPDQSETSNLSDGKKKKSLSGVRENRTSSSVISIEDRRTVRTEDARAVFAPAENQNGEELVLEMDPGESLDGAAFTGGSSEAGNRQFVLNTAEEQKGAFLLNRQLQEGGTRDLAKNIRFVLKDRNQGEIKLILKPESLGKVRIHLNLQENNIVGKIFVENNNVKQVFMNNLSDLAKALEDSGFQNASLDVSVGGGETGRQDQHRQETPVFFQRDASELDESVPVRYENGGSLSQIDLVI